MNVEEILHREVMRRWEGRRVGCHRVLPRRWWRRFDGDEDGARPAARALERVAVLGSGLEPAGAPPLLRRRLAEEPIVVLLLLAIVLLLVVIVVLVDDLGIELVVPVGGRRRRRRVQQPIQARARSPTVAVQPLLLQPQRERIVVSERLLCLSLPQRVELPPVRHQKHLRLGDAVVVQRALEHPLPEDAKDDHHEAEDRDDRAKLADRTEDRTYQHRHARYVLERTQGAERADRS